MAIIYIFLIFVIITMTRQKQVQHDAAMSSVCISLLTEMHASDYERQLNASVITTDHVISCNRRRGLAEVRVRLLPR